MPACEIAIEVGADAGVCLDLILEHIDAPYHDLVVGPLGASVTLTVRDTPAARVVGVLRQHLGQQLKACTIRAV